MDCISWGCDGNVLAGSVFCLEHTAPPRAPECSNEDIQRSYEDEPGDEDGTSEQSVSVVNTGSYANLANTMQASAMNWAPAETGAFGTFSRSESPLCPDCYSSMRIPVVDENRGRAWECGLKYTAIDGANHSYRGTWHSLCDFRRDAMNEERNSVITHIDSIVLGTSVHELQRLFMTGFSEAKRRVRNEIVGLEHRNEGQERSEDSGRNQARRHERAERRERYTVAESIDSAFGPEDASSGTEQG